MASKASSAAATPKKAALLERAAFGAAVKAERQQKEKHARSKSKKNKSKQARRAAGNGGGGGDGAAAAAAPVEPEAPAAAAAPAAVEPETETEAAPAIVDAPAPQLEVAAAIVILRVASPELTLAAEEQEQEQQVQQQEANEAAPEAASAAAEPLAVAANDDANDNNDNDGPKDDDATPTPATIVAFDAAAEVEALLAASPFERAAYSYCRPSSAAAPRRRAAVVVAKRATSCTAALPAAAPLIIARHPAAAQQPSAELLAAAKAYEVAPGLYRASEGATLFGTGLLCLAAAGAAAGLLLSSPLASAVPGLARDAAAVAVYWPGTWMRRGFGAIMTSGLFNAAHGNDSTLCSGPARVAAEGAFALAEAACAASATLGARCVGGAIKAAQGPAGLLALPITVGKMALGGAAVVAGLGGMAAAKVVRGWVFGRRQPAAADSQA
jgi:hypothetical protein